MARKLRRYPFVQVDVFTARPLEGNSLAVFLDGRGLSDDEMQALAREMKFAETVFLLPAPGESEVGEEQQRADPDGADHDPAGRDRPDHLPVEHSVGGAGEAARQPEPEQHRPELGEDREQHRGQRYHRQRPLLR